MSFASTLRGVAATCTGILGSMANPAWTPDDDVIARANLTALMRRRGISDLPSLHRWSTDHRPEFWGAVIDELGIVFDRTPETILGSDDPEHPDWLPGARMNIVASVFAAADPGAPAVVHHRGGRTETVTYGELERLVGDFAAGFSAAGWSPGDRVAIAMEMNLESVVAYLGIVAAGGVVVSIADSFAPDEIRTRLDITRPVGIVTQDVIHRAGRTLPMYQKILDADAPTAVVVGDGAERRVGDRSWDAFCVTGAGAPVPLTVHPGAHTNILFSSGTTGIPKAIPWTHTTPIKAAMDGRYHQDIHPGDVVAWPTNLGWMMGPWLIYASLLNGAAFALYDDAPTTRGFCEFVAEVGVTMLGVVPSIVTTWRTNGALDGVDLSAVRVLSSTGEASNPDDYRWLMERAGAPVIEYCGGTEIGGAYISATVLEPAVPSTFTMPTLGLDIRILDEDGRPADEGEVFLVPPSIGMSTELLNGDHHRVYFAGVPAADVPLRRHGDRMRRLPDGRYRAEGRIDDTMNLGGIKVSSAEIERVVSTVDGVAEAAAVAVAPEGGGPDQLVVFAVPDGEADPDVLRERMQQAIRRDLNPLFKVAAVHLIDALPRTASHKVMRRVLRDRLSSR